MARLRPPEAVRGRPGAARLGAVPRRRRDGLAAARGEHPGRARSTGVGGVPHAAPQPLSRAVAVARRGLPRLEPASLQPHERALERRPGPRKSTVRRNARHAAGRPSARLLGRPRGVPRAAEPLHHARGAPGVRARAQRRLLPHPDVAGGALSQVLRLPPRLSRRHAGPASHLDRLHEQLPQVRQADRAAQSRRKMKLLVTGAAGFIGMHCAKRMLERGDEVLGIDNLSPYYSVELKKARLKRLEHDRFRFLPLDLTNAAGLERLFDDEKPAAVLHLAAQPWGRYSLNNPVAYGQSNLVGFANLLEGCRRCPPRHLVFASSSSIYGNNPKLPWSESDSVALPISLYAATKKSNELMAHVYSHLYAISATGLRYFTAYGPWGRPDMSPVLFAHAIMEGKPIEVFNHGDMQRDFTYIDDIVVGTLRVLDQPAPYAIYNIGNHRPVQLLDYIAALERVLGKKAKIEMKPMQPGDVKATCADTQVAFTSPGCIGFISIFAFLPSTRSSAAM